jgi:hypothetical protein
MADSPYMPGRDWYASGSGSSIARSCARCGTECMTGTTEAEANREVDI